jgi:hypothetical protein
MDNLKDHIFIEGKEIEKIIEEWNALPWYKRLFFNLKCFWNRNF